MPDRPEASSSRLSDTRPRPCARSDGEVSKRPVPTRAPDGPSTSTGLLVLPPGPQPARTARSRLIHICGATAALMPGTPTSSMLAPAPYGTSGLAEPGGIRRVSCLTRGAGWGHGPVIFRGGRSRAFGFGGQRMEATSSAGIDLLICRGGVADPGTGLEIGGASHGRGSWPPGAIRARTDRFQGPPMMAARDQRLGEMLRSRPPAKGEP